MICYDCHQDGKTAEAIGVCHHCSIAVCPAHGAMYTHPTPAPEPAAKAASLPSHYRSLLCPHCLEAIKQSPEIGHDTVTCVRVPRPTFPWG